MIDLEQILRETLELTPLSETANRLAAMVTDEDVGLDEIAEVVAYDPPLAGCALKAANAASAGSLREIVDVELAVMRLGPSWILSMAIGNAVKGDLQEAQPAFGLKDGELWHHAIASSIAAEEIASFSHGHVPPQSSSAALLHDVGKIVLARHVTRPMQLGIQRGCKKQGLSGLHAETSAMDINHAELGGMIVRHWKLPDAMASAITHHHHPNEAPEEHRVLAHAVHLADICANLAWGGAKKSYLSVDELRDSLEILSLTPRSMVPLVHLVTERTADVLSTYA